MDLAYIPSLGRICARINGRDRWRRNFSLAFYWPWWDDGLKGRDAKSILKLNELPQISILGQVVVSSSLVHFRCLLKQ